MPKREEPKNQSQKAKFIAMAKELETNDNEAAFDAALKKLATPRSTKKFK